MHVTVLCGGKGTRLGADGPKCLVDINGRPFMDYKLDQLRRCGATDICLAVGPHADAFREYDLPMIEDDQSGIANVLQWVENWTWWTMGDVLLEETMYRLSWQTMVVRRNHEKANIAGLYLDCGLYYGKGSFRMMETAAVPYTINTPADLEETRAYLG